MCANSTKHADYYSQSVFDFQFWNNDRQRAQNFVVDDHHYRNESRVDKEGSDHAITKASRISVFAAFSMGERIDQVVDA